MRDRLISSGILGPDAYVVLSGPANAYGHYVTTREEYSVQRYEGASTVFGPCECFFIFLHFVNEDSGKKSTIYTFPNVHSRLSTTATTRNAIRLIPVDLYLHPTRFQLSSSNGDNFFSPFLTVTLEAYIDKYTSLVPNLADGAAWTPASDPPPPEQTSNAISLRVSRFFPIDVFTLNSDCRLRWFMMVYLVGEHLGPFYWM